MYTQIQISAREVEGEDQMLDIHIRPREELPPVSLILKGQFGLAGNDMLYPPDLPILDKILSAARETLVVAAQYPLANPMVPQEFLDFNLQDHRHALISVDKK